MADSVDRAKIMNSLKKKAKGAYKKARDTEARAKGQVLPGGLTRAVAKLSSWDVGPDKNGNPFFKITGIVQEPAEYEGMKAVTMHFISETQNKTIEDKLAALVSDIKLLGGETEGTEVDDLPDILENLVQQQPYYYFNTWKPEEDRGAMVMIQGLAQDWNDDEDDTEEPPFEEEAEEEEFEEDDSEEVEEAAEEEEEPELTLGLKVQVTENDGSTWTGTISGIDNGEFSVTSDEDDTEYGTYGEDALIPVYDAPVVDTVVSYGGDPHHVTSVDEESMTCDLQRVEDEEEVNGVSWADLDV